MKNLIKNITPPFLYSWLRRIFVKPPVYIPEWITLSYEPMVGVKMFFDPKGPWQKRLLVDSYDSFFFDRLKKIDLKGKTIYDIGAHVGFHSLYFARLVGSEGRVYAFEPNPKNVERFSFVLAENKDLSPIVTICDAALSDKKGTEKFSMNSDVESGRSSGSFIDSADTMWDREAFKERGFFEIEVKTIPLDSLKSEMGFDRAPDVMKIDVEGAESLVLKGASETIKKYRPLILLEVHSMPNMLEVARFFSSIEYDLEILNEESYGRCFIEAKPRVLR